MAGGAWITSNISDVMKCAPGMACLVGVWRTGTADACPPSAPILGFDLRAE